jgi:hypothetical protein
MSIGNLKDQGNKGNNFPYQFRNLQLLGSLNDCCTASSGTLLSILAALQNGQNFIQTLVEDQGGAGCPTNCPVYLEVKIWNGTGFDPAVYYDAAGNIVVPIGPLVYLNPDFHLAQMVLLLTSIDNSVDVNLSTRNAEATQLLIKALLTTIDGDTSNLDTPLSNLNKEATQLLIKNLLTSIDADTSNIAADTTATRTAKVISTTGSGTIPGNPMTVSIFNANTMSGSITIDGTTISVPGGVTLSYDAGGLNNKFATGNFVYNATGTTFIITYVI